jgi:hypothetical protein
MGRLAASLEEQGFEVEFATSPGERCRGALSEACFCHDDDHGSRPAVVVPV